MSCSPATGDISRRFPYALAEVAGILPHFFSDYQPDRIQTRTDPVCYMGMLTVLGIKPESQEAEMSNKMKLYRSEKRQYEKGEVGEERRMDSPTP